MPQTIKDKIIWVTDTTTLGRGDLEYLQKLIKAFKTMLNNPQYVKHIALVCIPKKNNTLLKCNDKTCHSKDCKHPKVPTIESKENFYVFVYEKDGQAQAKILDIYKELNPSTVIAVIAVSSRAAEHLCYNAQRWQTGITIPPFFSIQEHGVPKEHLTTSERLQSNFQKRYIIGFEYGFLLEKPIIRPEDKTARINCLPKINNNYVKFLINKAVTTDQVTEDKCKKFVNNNLFIPGYYQDEGALKHFINGVCQSKLDEKYQEGITFHLSIHKNIQKYNNLNAVYKIISKR